MMLKTLGWEFFSKSIDFAMRDTHSGLIPARVMAEMKGAYLLQCEQGECRATMPGRSRYIANDRADFPVVGDWVLLADFSERDLLIIREILPRKSMVSRKVAGEQIQEQPLAANIDFVFLLMGLDQDFNLKRLERYLALVWNSGASPVILLNKKDLVDKQQFEACKRAVEDIAFGVPVYGMSLSDCGELDKASPVGCSHVGGSPEKGVKQALDFLAKYITTENTIVLLGSSGVGKSTLTNILLGKAAQAVSKVREEDSKGRHTTTQRQLFVLPSGAMLIDTPGMRELQLWCSEESVEHQLQYFQDVEALAAECRFHDCQHDAEPSCAVKQAIEDHVLDASRLHNYQKLQKELKQLAKRQQATKQSSRRTDRKLSKLSKKAIKNKHQRYE